MDESGTGRFSIPDYVVFFVMLLISLAIGIYSTFAGKRKPKTTADFYFGNRDMNVVAVALSQAATFLSAVGLLGVPSEVYRNGIAYCILIIAEIVIDVLVIILIIPFFYQLNLTSVYEYFEHRFNRTIRRFACLLFATNMLLYISIVLYAPALALSQVSGLPIWVSILAGGLICTVYTSIGGIKAVIWTDAFQMIIMLGGVLLILIHGIVSAGGSEKIFQANQNTGRLHISFDPDPSAHSFWALAVGGSFTCLSFILNQATVQRFLSVKNQRTAQGIWALKLPIFIIWWSILVIIGTVMFAYYQGCDPQLAKRIERPDQMLPVFVGDILGYLQGLPGLFTAVVYSATLSTVSSGVNSIALVLTEDFIKPLYHLRTKIFLAEQTVMRVTRGISVLVGFSAIGLAFASSAMGRGLIQFVMSVDGMCGGPMSGLFICGMLLPYCNSKGAGAGVLLGLAVTFWLGIGSIVAGRPKPTLPLTADFCPNTNLTVNAWLGNVTSMGVFLADSNISTTTSTVKSSSPLTAIERVYGISYQWYGMIGCLITITVATIVSFATGRQDSTTIPDRFFLYKVKLCQKAR